jgi:undecaprenyl phosphate N,N'-diacetylbacillosamine 1-phosphate transferase
MFKRAIDFILSLGGFIVLCPVFFIVTILLWINNNGKPFFVQQRPGRHAIPFKLIKFKTMNDRVDAAGNLMPDADRLTSLGTFIRKTSLDEIPQLLNVIKGDMSLIGPRPLLMEYLDFYSPEQSRRHEVRPGITGWAQVNGRNAISWQQKFQYDVWYVDHVSFMLDLRIILITLLKVFKAEGISGAGVATAERFTGKN